MEGATPDVVRPLPVRRQLVYDPPTTPLDILHLDAQLIVVDKPAGLLSVPGRSEPDCLHARLMVEHPEARLIHRLDMATSGVMIFARTAEAQRHLGLQFERRHVRKTYTARVAGEVHGESGRIDLPLIANWPERPVQMVNFAHGKSAVTDWEVTARESGATRLSLHPITGRSHQLRVHCWAMGWPILGDMIYGVDPVYEGADRLQLHAQQLNIRHPDGGATMQFEAPCPF